AALHVQVAAGHGDRHRGGGAIGDAVGGLVGEGVDAGEAGAVDVVDGVVEDRRRAVRIDRHGGAVAGGVGQVGDAHGPGGAVVGQHVDVHGDAGEGGGRIITGDRDGGAGGEGQIVDGENIVVAALVVIGPAEHQILSRAPANA